MTCSFPRCNDTQVAVIYRAVKGRELRACEYHWQRYAENREALEKMARRHGDRLED